LIRHSGPGVGRRRQTRGAGLRAGRRSPIPVALELGETAGFGTVGGIGVDLLVTGEAELVGPLARHGIGWRGGNYVP